MMSDMLGKDKITAKRLSDETVGQLRQPVATFESLSAEIRKTASIPDRVADFMKDMILSGQWRPGDRIVETQVARKLDIGQPAVREALGKLEEAGLVQRFPNSGCVVTQLSRAEFGQIFRVRTELEGLAVELAIANKHPSKAQWLQASLANLQKAGHKGNAEEYYRADFDFHRTIWQLADNRFLEKSLTQLVIPLFNFAVIQVLANHPIDLERDAGEHDQIVDAILAGDSKQARKVIRRVMNDFWERGVALVETPSAHQSGSEDVRKSSKNRPR